MTTPATPAIGASSPSSLSWDAIDWRQAARQVKRLQMRIAKAVRDGRWGQEPAILAQRQTVYEQARERHPERWSGPIRNWQPITEVWLNPSAEVIEAPVRDLQTG